MTYMSSDLFIGPPRLSWILPLDGSTWINMIWWRADFQHKHLPQTTASLLACVNMQGWCTKAFWPIFSPILCIFLSVCKQDIIWNQLGGQQVWHKTKLHHFPRHAHQFVRCLSSTFFTILFSLEGFIYLQFTTIGTCSTRLVCHHCSPVIYLSTNLCKFIMCHPRMPSTKKIESMEGNSSNVLGFIVDSI